MLNIFNKILSTLFAVVFASVLSSCHSTKTVATWEKEGLKPKVYSKMVVYCNAPTIATRATIEKTIASYFTYEGMKSVSAVDKLPNFKRDSLGKLPPMRDALDPISADLLLVISQGNSREFLETNSAVRMYPGNLNSSLYGVSESVVSYSKMEHLLYNALTNELLMAVDTETDVVVGDHIGDMSILLAKSLVREMDGRALFFVK
jgi:hypothetical protein